MPNEVAHSLGKKIKELAEAKGLSVNRLASLSGMTHPTLQSILEKNDAKLSQVTSIANALEVSVAELLGIGLEGSALSDNVAGKQEAMITSILNRVQVLEDQVRLLLRQQGSPAKVPAMSFEELTEEVLSDGNNNVVLTVLYAMTMGEREKKMSDFKELLGDVLSDEQIKYLIYKMSQTEGLLLQTGIGKGTKYTLTDKGQEEFEYRLHRLAREQDGGRKG